MSKTAIPLEENGSYYPKEDINYLGETFTMDEYLGMDMQQIEMLEGNEQGSIQMNM